MTKMLKRIVKPCGRLLADESGVTMLEYTILIGIITAAVIASVAYAGTWVTGKWTTLTGFLT
ncbi:MAG: Flp family type IVb pilin [Alphaproteobacteria bacterium]|jgi:pilus assembly protein Flp/PilA|nr:MAG: Flp family type IVb pilin [Alphaproteobacteria bacterium]